MNLKFVLRIPLGLIAASISEKIDKMVAKHPNLATLDWLQKVRHLRSKNRIPENIEYVPHKVTIEWSSCRASFWFVSQLSRLSDCL